MAEKFTADDIAEPLEWGDLDLLISSSWETRNPAVARLERAGLLASNGALTRKDGWLQFYRTDLARQLGTWKRHHFQYSKLGLDVLARVAIRRFSRERMFCQRHENGVLAYFASSPEIVQCCLSEQETQDIIQVEVLPDVDGSYWAWLSYDHECFRFIQSIRTLMPGDLEEAEREARGIIVKVRLVPVEETP